MRLFVAVEIPDAHKASIFRATQALQLKVPDARWVSRDAWHCTLKFLGEVPDDAVGDVEDLVAQAVDHSVALETSLTDIGTFPGENEPARVIWAGMDDPTNELSYLASRLERRLGAAGFRQEARRLHPHITLARLSKPRRVSKEIAAAGPYRLDRSPFWIGEVVLFRSHLGPNGSTYEAVDRWPLPRLG